MHRALIILLTLISFRSYAELGYGIVIQKVLPQSLQGIIANYYGITPKVGEKLFVPFTTIDYCTAKIESVKKNYLQAKLIDCDLDKVKEGQRLLIARTKTKATSVIPIAMAKKIISKKRIGKGILHFISGDLGSSTATVSIPENGLAPVGADYSTESIMGAECTVKLIKTDGNIGTVDSSTCSFEREFYSGQEFIPIN